MASPPSSQGHGSDSAPTAPESLITQVSSNTPTIGIRQGPAKPVRTRKTNQANKNNSNNNNNIAAPSSLSPSAGTPAAAVVTPSGPPVQAPTRSQSLTSRQKAVAASNTNTSNNNSNNTNRNNNNNNNNNKSLPPNSSPITSTATTPSSPDYNNDNSDDKEKNSSSSLTATGDSLSAPSQKPGQTSSSQKPSSNNNYSNGNNKNRSSKANSGGKPRWVTSFLEVLLPCASSSAFKDKSPSSSSSPSSNTNNKKSSRPSSRVSPTSPPNATNTVAAASTKQTNNNNNIQAHDHDSPSSDISPSGGTKLSRDETADVLSGAVVPPGAEGSTSRRSRKASKILNAHEHQDEDPSQSLTSTPTSPDAETSEEEFLQHDDYVDDAFDDDEDDEEERIIAQGGMGIPIGPNGEPQPLLADVVPQDKGRKCLVLDLDETLVHSTFKIDPQFVQHADYVVPVEIENQTHNVYVIKRPGVDSFLQKMGELYEIVIFTASLAKYADPVLDHLDIHHVVRHRLFRESCFNHKGNYVKDLSQLGRPLSQVLILDNSPASYMFHPHNAVPVSTWFSDNHDTELLDLQQFLTDLADCDDVRGILHNGLPIETSGHDSGFST